MFAALRGPPALPFACVTKGQLVRDEDVDQEAERDFAAAAWAFDLPSDEGEGEDDERGMHCLERLISARLSEMQLLSAPGEQAARKGRHGPIAARMSKRNVYGGRLTISASDDRLEALDEYVTCRSRAGVSAGKWMFEVLVRSSGLLQVGWATAQCGFSDQDGVGDTWNSLAFDGSRALLLRQGQVAPYGKMCLPGDAVGCILDLEKGEASFSINGELLGVACSFRPPSPGTVYYPAVTLTHAQVISVNLGSVPQQFSPPEGVHTLAPPPPRAVRAAAHFLASALARVGHRACNPARLHDSVQHTARTVFRAPLPSSTPGASPGASDATTSQVARGDQVARGSQVARGAHAARGETAVWAEGFAPGSGAVLAAAAAFLPLTHLVANLSQAPSSAQGGRHLPTFIAREALLSALLALALPPPPSSSTLLRPHARPPPTTGTDQAARGREGTLGEGGGLVVPAGVGGAVYAVGLLAVLNRTAGWPGLWLTVVSALGERSLGASLYLPILTRGRCNGSNPPLVGGAMAPNAPG
ncbi:hypothetical protein T484DRAFT_1884363, partial [Baffinella frigidus]